MAEKIKSVFICDNCGYESAKWQGKCPSCDEWNTFSEQVVKKAASQKRFITTSQSKLYTLSTIDSDKEVRFDTGLSEFNRVLGGGIVNGSLILLSGDPGIGKSTLLLQVCEYLSKNNKILYVSGEESAHQLKIRARRLGVKSEELLILCETDAEIIASQISNEKPNIVIIDSIQTMSIPEISSSPGSITQVRECTNLFMRMAKGHDISIILVGHVNKDGNIAGPKVLEHIVDTVLYFEGERNLTYRILRAAKNRFGSTNEIGVFDMSSKGLCEVLNPSAAMISGRPLGASGTCVSCFIEGSRPILAEIQGLATPTGFGNPRRMATGFDYNRMSMLIAILEKRAGYFLGNMDCYVNIVGGLKADEPAADLAVALALISSLKDKVIDKNVAAFGEIGLAGEIRAISNCEQRVLEAKRLGFTRCILPKHNLKSISKEAVKDMEIAGVRTIREAFEAITD
ncbi:MAG TPA: DNA repair protein RadA [Oscillospiraceae bacterium]|nr:DNA repair protein RadA [Oscillospiraceae bacterium]